MVLCTACGNQSAPSTTTLPKPTLRGLVGLSYTNATIGCGQGVGGFDDIRVGANVVVKDGQGVVVGVGSIDSTDQVPSARTCAFGFTVPLSALADFYTVEIAGRGGPTFSHADLEHNAWQVTLSLG